MMDVLLDEIESLEAILMDDVRINRNPETGQPEVIETTIFPAVEHDSEKQYICVDLQVIPTEGYPEISPKFNLIKPRGLDDCRLDAIRLACIVKLNEMRGFPVVFDLIDVIREYLSGSNLPCGQCVVCLYGFHDGDEFIKTKCYHYLHSYCLARHLVAARKNHQEEQEKLPAWIRKASEPFQASCPVCREIIKDESDSLKSCSPPKELVNAPEFELTEEILNLQKKMSNLFIEQKNRGSIIDVEAEVGTVISIESMDGTTEEQVSKHHTTESSTYLKEDHLPSHHNTLRKSGCSGETSVSNKKIGQNRKPSNVANDVNVNISQANASTNFAPVVLQSHRMASDPTNNNYHHLNRRHFRRRRSHQQHQKFENASQLRAVSPPAGQSAPQANLDKEQNSVPNCSGSTR